MAYASGKRGEGRGVHPVENCLAAEGKKTKAGGMHYMMYNQIAACWCCFVQLAVRGLVAMVVGVRVAELDRVDISPSHILLSHSLRDAPFAYA